MTQSANCQPPSPVLTTGENLTEPSAMTSTRRHNLIVILLALMMFLAPALGMPGEEILQDTFKSTLVSLFALVASLIFFWPQRQRQGSLQFHGLLCFPLVLTVYALGSMAWSHTYLAGGEVVRWFVFGLLLFLGTATLTLPRVTRLAWGIHLGAVMASLWAALQFWLDLSLFPTLSPPASTFANPNFFAEFVVCSVPFSVFLITTLRNKPLIFLLIFSLGFNVVALMMTGTRSALSGLLLMVLLLPVILGLYRKQLGAITGWSWGHRVALAALLAATVWGLGSINASNRHLIAAYGQGDAIDRAFKRSQSILKAEEYSSGSFALRIMLWKETGKMIRTHFVTGVGAGGWEALEPLAQAPGVGFVIPLYAHNELLQLLAEYGLSGWLVLLSLLTYLLWATYRTWSDQSEAGRREAPLRALTLTSLLMLFLVSNAGFPWHLASTLAIFALSLSILAASDMRLGLGRPWLWLSVPWRAKYGNGAWVALALCTMLALYIAQQAVSCELKVLRAYNMARAITQSGQPQDSRWEPAKVQIRTLISEGIAINPHHRTIIPQVGEELASWGEWENAAQIWESVLATRPNIVVIATNISRAYLEVGKYQLARDYFDYAVKLQPAAPSVRSLHAMFLIHAGQYPQAAQIVKELLQLKSVDDIVIRLTYLLGSATGDWSLTIEALRLRIKHMPIDLANDWLNLGNVYNKAEVNNETQALLSYRAALKAVPYYLQNTFMAKIPPKYWSSLQQSKRDQRD